jgi:hypothetical protein
MKKMFSPILWMLLFTTILAVIAFVLIIRETGTNFVHKDPASETLYRLAEDRVSFPARGRGGALDSAFTQFIDRHSAYRVPDSIQQRLSNINCHCLNFQRYIYFEKEPKEVYLTTYDYNSGVIDIIYIPKGGLWEETRSSRLDSLDKIRIRSRLIREVLDSLPAATHFE